MKETTKDEEPKIEFIGSEKIMETYENGRTTPMASGLMAVKNQGNSSSRLLRVLYDSGRSKSMRHRSIVLRGTRLTQSNGRPFMNTLVGTYPSMGSVTMTGLGPPAFDKTEL